MKDSGNYCKTRGLILKKTDFQETDRFIILYTSEYGKIKTKIRGIRNAGSKLAGAMEPFNLLDLVLYRKSRLYYTITQAEVTRSFLKIRNNLTKLFHGFYILHMLNRLVDYEEPNQILFDLVVDVFGRLETLENSDSLLVYWELKFLTLAGYRPQTESCVVCGNKPADDAGIYFSADQGGIVCGKCFGNCRSDFQEENEGTEQISRGTWCVLNLLLNSELRDLGKLKISSRQNKEIEGLTGKLLRYNFATFINRYRISNS